MPPARLALYGATASVFGLAASALFVKISPIVLGAAALGYVGFVTASCLNLSWRVFVDAVLTGPADTQAVALTFDDGPHPVHTRRVIALLSEHGHKATFFVIGKKAEAHPEVVREIVDAGHDVGIHSFEHDRLFSLRSPRTIRRDLERACASLQTLTGQPARLFRPPIGHTNPALSTIVSDLGLTVIGWSVRALDGLGAPAETVLSRIVPRLRAGSVIAMHDAREHGDEEPGSVKALAALLAELDRRGLKTRLVREFVDGTCV